MSDSPRMDRLTWVLPVVLVLAIVGQNVLTLLTLREIRGVSAQLQALGGRLSAEAPAGTPSVLPVGMEAPEFQYADSSNQPVALSEFRGREVLLVFSSPTCPYCLKLYPELNRFSQTSTPQRLDLLLLQLGTTPDQNRELRREHQMEFEVLAAETRTFMDYQVPGTPFLVLVDREGKVLNSGTANTYDQIVAMIPQPVGP